MNLTEQLSTGEGRKTTEEIEVAKAGRYSMNEFPSLEMKLIPEDLELEKGKKRGLEGAIQPPPQQRRKGGSRGSSVPPGSATAMARQRAEAMNLQQPTGKGSGKGTSQGKGWATELLPGKLPPDFQAVSSTTQFGDKFIEERKNMIYHQKLYNQAWDTLQGTLKSLGTSEDNLPAFECTFIHWFRYMEINPMNVPLEAILHPLFEVERDAYFADIPQDVSDDVLALHKAIIVDSLTNVKNFISSFGVIVRDFFDQDKSRFTLHPKGKGGKGGKVEAFPALGGKQFGKSTNRPKEPTPVPKQGGPEPLSKPKGVVAIAAMSTPLVLHKPPTRAEGATPLVIGKQPATTQPKVEAVATDQPLTKAGSLVMDPPILKAEPDQPKPKAEAAVAVEPLKAKAETVVTQDPPKAKAEAVVVADAPKAEGQPKSLLSLAGLKGRSGFGPPSKPEKPPPLSQADPVGHEEDEDADVQAAIQASLQTPTSPQLESGAQSSTPKPMTDLDQQESELMSQFDRLMAESLRLETLSNPSIRDSSRIRSIDVVSRGIEKQLEETKQRRLQSSPPTLQTQSTIVQPAASSAVSQAPRAESAPVQVKPVSPHRGEPLTVEKLMSGITGQKEAPAISAAASQSVQSVTGVPHRPSTPPVREDRPDRLESRERTPARQPSSVTPQREVQTAVPAIEDGPPPRRELVEEPPKERERTPPKKRSHDRRRRSPSPSRARPSKERQHSSTPPKERSHRRRRRSPTPSRDRTSEERQPSPPPPKERSHRRRRRSPTPFRDRQSEERQRSPSPPREPPRERRRRRRSLESSEASKEERRRSPPPKEVSPESPKVRSKKTKKSEKKEKKDSRGRRRTEREEPVRDRTPQEERSRSTRRPESPPTQEPQAVQVEASETEEQSSKDGPQLAIQDRPPKTRPRFDPSREHVAAQRIADKRRVVLPPREHQRDPSTEGPPDLEEERRMKRKPPTPPPATSTRQAPSGHRSLAFARPPLRRDSATESPQVPSEREPLRLRVQSQETLPQRPMPRRVVATPVGGSAPPRLQVTSSRLTRGEYQGQSQVRDDRSHGQEWSEQWQGQREYSERGHVRPDQSSQYRTEGPQGQQERQDWGSSQRRVPSMGHRESMNQPPWSEQRYSGQRHQDWSQQPSSTQERWYDPQQGHQQYQSQQALHHSIGLCNNNNNNHNSNRCQHCQHLFSLRVCNQVYNHLQV